MTYLDHPSPWLGLGGFAVVCAAAALTRLPRRIQPPSGRLAAIDGLRGLLALAVFFHHFFIAYQWKHTGRWTPPPTHLYDLFGSGSVTLFFMITGFLFFGRLKATRGRLDFNTFFVGRLFRLLPIYLVMLGLMLAAGLVALHAGWSSAMRPALDHWLLFQPGLLNGVADTALINAGVQWTLVYEWLFYLALPALALGWRLMGCGSWVLFVLSAVTLMLALGNVAVPALDLPAAMFAPFALGGLVGEANRAPAVRALLRDGRGAMLSGAAAAMTFGLCDTAYSVTGFLLLAVAFAPIAAGNTLFGALSTRTLLMLGEISYDIYLLHGVVLFGLYSLLMPDALARASTPGRLFALLAIASLCTLAVAVMTHVLVERPCLRFGRKVVRIDRMQELAAP